MLMSFSIRVSLPPLVALSVLVAFWIVRWTTWGANVPKLALVTPPTNTFCKVSTHRLVVLGGKGCHRCLTLKLSGGRQVVIVVDG